MLNKLFNEDCLETMKRMEDNSVDFIVADPPYLISNKKDTFAQSSNNNLSKCRTVQGDWDLGDNEIIYDCIKEFKRILKRGGSLIIWYDWKKISYVYECLDSFNLKQIRLCEWLKINPVPLASENSYLGNSKEYFVYAAKNTSYKKEWFKATFNSKYDKGVYECSIAGKSRIHPTEKPYKLMEEIILKHTNSGDVVYIPFGGSGVDVEVCIRNDRNYICSELSPEYCLGIEKRISDL